MSDTGARKTRASKNGSEKGPGSALKSKAGRKRLADKPVKDDQKAAASSHELSVYSRRMLSLLAKEQEISQGIFYIIDESENKKILRILSAYAYDSTDTGNRIFELGEGFPGQVAIDGTLINISEVPDGYVSIVSGLGSAKPASLIVFPVVYEDEVIAVVELASFHRFSEEDEDFFTKFANNVAVKIHGLLNSK